MIRRADVSDVPALLALCQRFDQFFGAQRPLFDPATAHDTLAHLVQSHPFWLAIEGDTVVGFIGGTLGPHPFNPTITVLSELFWWVDAEHRGNSAGARLLDAFLSFGHAHADWIVMTLEHESPVSDRVLLKRGFRPKERSYLLEV